MSDDMAKSWRARRLAACRAIGDLNTIIDNLGKEEAGAEPVPADRNPPPINGAVRRSLQKHTDALLNMILMFNDGGGTH